MSSAAIKIGFLNRTVHSAIEVLQDIRFEVFGSVKPKSVDSNRLDQPLGIPHHQTEGIFFNGVTR